MSVSQEQYENAKFSFRVKYRFYSLEEGGRMTIPVQGYRSDFWYEGYEDFGKRIYMIWPIFEDGSQNVIKEGEMVNRIGTARMYIASAGFIDFHKNRIHLGMKGYFMEGPNKVAECEVIELNFE